MQARFSFWVLVLAALLSSGCSALIARTKIVSAESALAEAKQAGAAEKSVYEYTGAELYLEKAREEEAYGRYGPAIDFGDTAEKLANEAKLNAATAEPPGPAASPEPSGPATLTAQPPAF